MFARAFFERSKSRFFCRFSPTLLVALFSAAGCDAIGPLPAGSLPADQTIEGGAQIRLTPSGFSKFKDLVENAVSDQLENGVCVPAGTADIGIGDIDYCHTPTGDCDSGCKLDLSPKSFDIFVDNNLLRFRAEAAGSTRLPIIAKDGLFGATLANCTIKVLLGNGELEGAISMGTNPNNGELTLDLDHVNLLQLEDISISGCGILGGLLDRLSRFVSGLIKDEFSDFAHDVLGKEVSAILETALPNPLGLVGTVDLTPTLNLLGLFPNKNNLENSNSRIEMRVVPGGYAEFKEDGVSMGVIMGFNHDGSPASRGTIQDSEPSPCGAASVTPDFRNILEKSKRGNFFIAEDPELSKIGQKHGGDVVVGVSQTSLNLLTHHIASSGSLCLRFTKEDISDLSIGSVGLFLPSLGELSQDHTDPLMLVTRATQAPHVKIGNGTEASPTLQITMPEFEADLYARVSERFVRVLTVSMELNLGVNLEFAARPDGSAFLFPILQVLDITDVGSLVKNNEFLREDHALLEGLLPPVINIALPKITENVGDVVIPQFAGFTLSNLVTQRVEGKEDVFLTVIATLASSKALTKLGRGARTTDFAASIAIQKAEPVKLDGLEPRLHEKEISATFRSNPTIQVDVPVKDSLNREIEWMYRVGNGMWHPFQKGPTISVEDPALSLQGRREIHLRARAVDQYQTLSRETNSMSYQLDTIAPRITANSALIQDEGLWIEATDFVTETAKLEFALGEIGSLSPSSAFSELPLSSSRAQQLAQSDRVTVWVRDEQGNQSKEELTLSSVGAGGCSSGQGRGLLFLLVCFVLVHTGKRIRHSNGILASTAVFFVSFGSGCSGDECRSVKECDISCDPGLFAVCTAGGCLCGSDSPYGTIGEQTDMAVAADQSVWLSSYNSEYGDLMVAHWESSGRVPSDAWEFVDGVPEGPILVDGGIRGGVYSSGEDVGRYTSIAMSLQEKPVVAYFDSDNGQVKFAQQTDDGWHLHAVDGHKAAEFAGKYAKVALDEFGRPGIAYRADVQRGHQTVSEIRFAQATVRSPRASSDWRIQTVASEVASHTEVGSGLPGGIGVTLDLVRDSDFNPVIAFYNREAGALTLATGFSTDDNAVETWTISELDGFADNEDVGFAPSLAAGTDLSVHVSYQDVRNNSLRYARTRIAPELVDSGVRPLADGSSDVHFVGGDSSVVVTPMGPMIAYQDSTTHELRLAKRTPKGFWTHEPVAGHEEQFSGAYGFYARAAFSQGDLVLANWVLSQPEDDAWVEILRAKITNR